MGLSHLALPTEVYCCIDNNYHCASHTCPALFDRGEEGRGGGKERGGREGEILLPGPPRSSDFYLTDMQLQDKS